MVGIITLILQSLASQKIIDIVEDGLLGRLRRGREEPRIRMKLKAVFRRKENRAGGLSDIFDNLRA